MQTSPAQVHGAKVLQNLRMCKKNRILVRFFWYKVLSVEAQSASLEDARGASYSLGFREKKLPFMRILHKWQGE